MHSGVNGVHITHSIQSGMHCRQQIHDNSKPMQVEGQQTATYHA